VTYRMDMDFLKIKKNLKKDYSKFPTIKIALLGDSATQFIVQAIKGLGFEYRINFDIYEADYNQIDQQIRDASSELYQFQPQFILIMNSAPKLQKHFYTLSEHDQAGYADERIQSTEQYATLIHKNCTAAILVFNIPAVQDSIFGNYSNKVQHSFLYQVRKYNLELANMSSRIANLFVVDIAAVINAKGYENSFDPRYYYNMDMVTTLDLMPLIARHCIDIIRAISGRFCKCVILDLDNTLWGGVIGDDGMEKIQIGSLGIGKAFSDFQLWLKQIKERGILLAVCSKNTEEIAKEPFESHPDMILRLEDFSVFVANWENKVKNIQYIQSVLNIGFDSFVYIDDNPMERDMVSSVLSEVVIPDMPDDPAEYLTFLQGLNLFETASYSINDKKRTEQYKAEANRKKSIEFFDSEDEYLQSLEMLATVTDFNKFNIPRVSQLSQRSNQFNLRTVRYNEEDIRRFAGSDQYTGFVFSLQDKFGDNGIVSVVITKLENDELFIDTWIMSCRVLKRTMEQLVFNTVLSHAKQAGLRRIIGEYLPTKKNVIVKGLLAQMGFKADGDYRWKLDIDGAVEQPSFIALTETKG
jgi:FkbH-like protein